MSALPEEGILCAYCRGESVLVGPVISRPTLASFDVGSLAIKQFETFLKAMLTIQSVRRASYQ